MNRRDTLRLLAATALSPTIAWGAPHLDFEMWDTEAGPQTDDAFLDDMQRRACLYFMEQAGAASGQVLDRAAASNETGQRDPRRMASIAATGFGLSALCIADRRNYFPRAQIVDQVRRTLRFHAETLPHVHGFFYHFNDVDTGARFGGCELSPIDTSLLLCGVLTARAHFHHDAEIVRLATAIYNRVDWPWMLNQPLNGPLSGPLNGPLNGAQAFAMGWSPEKGFQPGRWSHYCELMMIYLLALGSPTHPVPPATWDAFTRPTITYDGLTYISANDPLFVHQYSHAWFDLRHKRDRYTNYFTNSITATAAHKAFCLSLGPPYAPDYWGISASDSQHGYTAWGGPNAQGKGFGGIDGSVVPNATAGSLPFLPAECLRVLRSLKQTYPRSYGRYGFCDALHPAADWYDPDVLGIDLGIGLLMSENLRTGFLWTTFARNPEVGVAFRKAGFHAS